MIKKFLPLLLMLAFFAKAENLFAFSGSYGRSGSSRGPGFGTSGGTSLRCGSDLINIGDFKNEVYELCGEPESIDTHTKLVGSKFRFPNRTIDIQEFEEVEIEEWIYNFGSKRLRQYLRFENGRLVEIRSLGRSP